MSKKNNTLVCPECKGDRGSWSSSSSEMKYFVPCWYCAGTGFETDTDDSYREFWKEK